MKRGEWVYFHALLSCRAPEIHGKFFNMYSGTRERMEGTFGGVGTKGA